MLVFITDIQNEKEPDILSVVAKQNLEVRDLAGRVLLTLPAPRGGWTHSRLTQLGGDVAILARDGADAYVGGSWVGSTEV